MVLVGVAMRLACVAMRLAYDVWMCSGMPCFGMCACHVWWTRVEVLVGFVGSLRYRVSAGRNSIVLRVSRHVQSCASRPFRFLFGSLASIACVCCMQNRVFGLVLLQMVRMLLHLCIHVSHNGAKCFRRALEYCSSLQCCRTS